MYTILKIHHFAGDTSTMNSNKFLDVLAKLLNKHFPNPSYWLTAKKNVSKNLYTILETYFGGDTSIVGSNKFLDVLAKLLNKYLSNPSYRLRAKKLCPNLHKTKLIIFHPTILKRNSMFNKFKLQGKELIPTQVVQIKIY